VTKINLVVLRVTHVFGLKVPKKLLVAAWVLGSLEILSDVNMILLRALAKN
jgi:hypothetical protein